MRADGYLVQMSAVSVFLPKQSITLKLQSSNGLHLAQPQLSIRKSRSEYTKIVMGIPFNTMDLLGTVPMASLSSKNIPGQALVRLQGPFLLVARITWSRAYHPQRSQTTPKSSFQKL